MRYKVEVISYSAAAKRGKSSRLASDWLRLQREYQARESWEREEQHGFARVSEGFYIVYNNTHEKITRFWLAKSSAVQV